VGISLFLSGSRFRVLPVELYSYAYYNNDPLAAAVSVMLILLSLIGVIVELPPVVGHRLMLL
jgi:putative spermidine/putrescine transport system permease protein